jgi:hypothetical protein
MYTENLCSRLTELGLVSSRYMLERLECHGRGLVSSRYMLERLDYVPCGRGGSRGGDAVEVVEALSVLSSGLERHSSLPTLPDARIVCYQ